MNEDRREKVKALRTRLANLSEAEKASLIERGIVATVEGHPLSANNTCLVYFQRENPTIIGGYQQWKRSGRQVRKGEKSMIIWAPCKPKKKKDPDLAGALQDEEEEINFILCSVFDVSQTEPAEGHATITADAVSEEEMALQEEAAQ